MARIDVDNHFRDAAGNQYDVHMTDHTRGPLNAVLDGLCNFIDQTAVNGPGIVWTGWLEVTPGDFVYWVHPLSPLCAFLDAESIAQHPFNFLAFTQVGNQIVITHFGPFGWNKAWDLEKVRAAKKIAEDMAKEAEKERKRVEEEKKAWEKEDPPLSGEKPKKPRPRMPRWRSTKNDVAIAEMEAKVFIKVGELAVRKVAFDTAVIAGKNIAKAIAKATAKSGVKSGVKKVPVLGFIAGLGFGAWRAVQGDFTGAGLEVASGAASLVPGPGTAASLGIDVALLGKDLYETKKNAEAEEAKQKELYDKELKEWRDQRDTMISLLQEQIKELKDAEKGCNHCAEGCDHLIELGVKDGASDKAKE